MSEAADLVLTNGEVRTLAGGRADDPAGDDRAGEDDSVEVHEAVAVRDGRIVRVGSAYEVDFLAGVETRVVDLGGRTLIPGFVDAHTHLPMTGRHLVHADLSGTADADAALDRLRDRAAETDRGEWVLGFGYDESEWSERRYLAADALDAVSDSRPVAAFREDMHVASLNSVALDRHLVAMPDGDVRREGGDPTGVVVEEAVDVVYRAIEPDAAEMTELVRAAQRRANERGVTAVHDMVRRSSAPEGYRRLAIADELTVRVRLNYWRDHLDAVLETGLRTNHGSDRLETGAIKTYTDGSFGGRTAKLSEPYADGEGTGQWVVSPSDLDRLVTRVDEAELQMAAHAIGDAAVDSVLDAYEECVDPGEARHRIEHAELADDEAIDRLADLGVVASVQPNFLKWAGEENLYAGRIGERWRETNRYRDMLDAGVRLAFGSDCMPLDPLFGVHHAVNAPAPAQRLTVTEAVRAYTLGGAYAGFAEDRRGTIEPGKQADLTALDRSPWDHPDEIANVDVDLTVVGGEIVYDDR